MRRSAIASVALMLAGVAALVFMGPQFIVFIPILVGAWILARFGLVPRAVHARGDSVRIAGGPGAGALAFAEVTIMTERSRRATASALMRELVASAAGLLGAEAPDSGTTLFGWNGDAAALDAREGSEAAEWAARWPALVREQAERHARLAFAIADEEGSTTVVRACWIGERELLAALLIRFAQDIRVRHRVDAWITGWLRDAERESVMASTSRRRRA